MATTQRIQLKVKSIKTTEERKSKSALDKKIIYELKAVDDLNEYKVSIKSTTPFELSPEQSFHIDISD